MCIRDRENMVQKKAIIEKLNTIDAQETPEEDAGNTIRELMKEWNKMCIRDRCTHEAATSE